ncbi:MAG TPA: vWA domain-containing protein [Thermoanaerobaculia bacterium]|nr:vWA domain-containing protein [Thermoanaerobaculia bacterium]
MTRRLFAVVFLFIAVLTHAQPRGAIDWIFLVDTSKSMRSKDLFDHVKASLRTFVREASDGDTVSVYTFDRGVRLHSSGDIPLRRDDLYAVIDGLEANGNRTHLGLAIQEGLKRAESLRASADSTRRRAVVLFTDGKEDVRGIESPVEIASNLGRVGDAHIFFISLNEHEEKLDLFETATILKPTPEAIRDLAQQIRAKLPEPPPPPPKPQPKPVARPAPPPEPEGLPLWPIPIVILAVAAAIFAFLRHRRGNRLEGEIEIVEPRAASAFVGLPKLETNEVALSAIVPPDALAGSDARLFVRRRNGTKQICISAQSGSLRINDIETPLTELYDSDTIRIGDATLRFNRAGYHKPQEEL